MIFAYIALVAKLHGYRDTSQISRKVRMVAAGGAGGFTGKASFYRNRFIEHIELY